MINASPSPFSILDDGSSHAIFKIFLLTSEYSHLNHGHERLSNALLKLMTTITDLFFFLFFFKLEFHPIWIMRIWTTCSASHDCFPLAWHFLIFHFKSFVECFNSPASSQPNSIYHSFFFLLKFYILLSKQITSHIWIFFDHNKHKILIGNNFVPSLLSRKKTLSFEMFYRLFFTAVTVS